MSLRVYIKKNTVSNQSTVQFSKLLPVFYIIFKVTQINALKNFDDKNIGAENGD